MTPLAQLRIGIVLFAVGALLTVGYCGGKSSGERDHTEARAKQAAEQVLRLRRLSDVRDTVYRTAVRERVRVQTRTDSLLTTDTLFHVDTVRVLVEAERQACDAVVLACEARVAIRDSVIRAQQAETRVWRETMPSRWGRMKDGITGAVITGAIVGILATVR